MTDEQRPLRWLLALATPFIASLLRWLLADFVEPHVWFIFYPTLFISFWIGGVRPGLVATVINIALIWGFFIPPEQSLAAEHPWELLPTMSFILMGVLYAVFHDRLRKANRRASSALDRFVAIFQQAPDGIFVADLEGCYTGVNNAGCSMLGYAREEVIGKTIVDLIPPQDVDRLWQSRAQMLEGAVHVDEWLLRRKDGTWLPVEVSGKILPDGRWQGFVRDMSERKRLEEALRKSHADLERAQMVASIGSWSWDVCRNKMEWSDEAYRIFGVPLGTPLTYEAFLARVHPDDRACVDREWKAALQGAPYDVVYRMVAGDRIKWVRVKADLEYDERGVLQGGVGITEDITERKQLEMELRLAEAKSSGIVSIAADAIISIDEDQRITMFNNGAEKIFGYTKTEAIGAPLDTLIPERLRAHHRHHIERFAASQGPARRMGERSTSIVGLRKCGEEFPADAAISRLQVGGKLVLTVALRDVTEQRRSERDQKFLAEVGSVLASTLDYGETIKNIARLLTGDLADVCIVEAVETPAAACVCRLFVAHRDADKAAVAHHLQEIQLDRRLPYLGSAVFETKTSLLIGDVTPGYLDSIIQSDEHREAMRELDARSLIAVPLVVHGRIVGSLLLIRTTAARPYTREDLDVAENVALRAALAVENARLYKAAQRAIQARDDVLGVVAHDLRNPLGMILMQAALLQRRGGSSEGLGAIERAGSRMNRLIQDLLDVTRMEAGNLSIERCALSTKQLISEVLEAQKPLVAAAYLELRVDLAAPLPEVWGDRDRLLQVFENLIGNAMKFTDPGGHVTVGAAKRTTELLLWVADTGPGIRSEELPHLFDRFWQARKAGRRGAGLGLAIVKGIVEAHGGRIWVESTLGQGSTFFFTIPTGRRSPVR